MVCKKEKGREFLPAHAFAASLECRGEGMGGGGLGLCLWAKISTGPWMVHGNLSKKINSLVAKVVRKKKRRGNSYLHLRLLLLLTVQEGAWVMRFQIGLVSDVGCSSDEGHATF